MRTILLLILLALTAFFSTPIFSNSDRARTLNSFENASTFRTLEYSDSEDDDDDDDDDVDSHSI
ncbi:MAG: hypothetical protein H7A24_01260 [Leptospiraceae bacterium]|nr:hypothetical protein [Leptospiraceae bacterium]MCP5510481.1 hypothetical protein [Leptospiraceae bacterium]